jgi:hypothetical protein
MMDEMRKRRMQGECLFMNQFPIGLQLEVAAVGACRHKTAQTSEKFACVSRSLHSSIVIQPPIELFHKQMNS